jgi:putative acetyltransferase
MTSSIDELRLTLRPEAPGDEAVIGSVVTAAFGQPDEAELVARLRSAGALAASLVAETEGRIVGHAALSPVTIAGAEGGARWLGLAPLAVSPDRQRHGIGRQLVAAALDTARAQGAAAVFVLGRPAYYGPLGFDQADALGWRCVYDVPPAAFRVARLVSGGEAPPPGLVGYHSAFEAL